MTQTFNEKVDINHDLDVTGNVDIEGNLQVGSFTNGMMTTEDALIEAHRDENSTLPKRGLHLKGVVKDTLNMIVSWVMQELTLTGTGGVDAQHNALRVKLENDNTGTMTENADLRAISVEAINGGGDQNNNDGTLTGLHIDVNNESDSYLDTAYGIRVQMQNAPSGEVNDMYALHTSGGKVHFDGDVDFTGSLTHNGQSYGGSGSGGIQAVTAIAGENLAFHDVVYHDAASNKWYKVDVSAVPVKMSAYYGIVTASGGIVLDTGGEVTLGGPVSGFNSLTPMASIYASTIPGGITQERPAPVLNGDQVAIVTLGTALSTTELLLEHHTIRYMKYTTLLHSEPTSLDHHSDADRTVRQYYGWIHKNISTGLLASYSKAHQDSDVALKNRIISTYTQDKCSPGGSISSSSDTYGADTNAFDNNTGTAWGSNTTEPPCWIEYDFGTLETIRRYTITPDSTYSGRAPSDFELQYYDGSVWQTADSRTGATYPGGNGKQTFDVETVNAAERWRLYVTDNVSNNANTRVSEIEMMGAHTYENGAEKLAQSFEVNAIESISHVALYLKRVGGAYNFNPLTLRIETDNNGEPSGTLVNANASLDVYPQLELTNDYVELIFELTEIAILDAHTTYWIVLSLPGSFSESNYILWGADGSSPGYADGEMLSYDGTTWSAENKDAVFSVHRFGNDYLEPATLQRWFEGTERWTGIAGNFTENYSKGKADLGVRDTLGQAETSSYFTNYSGRTFNAMVAVDLPWGVTNSVNSSPAPSYKQTLLNTEATDLYAYWAMDESNGTAMLDSSTNAINGVYQNLTVGQSGIGDGGSSILANGSNSMVEMHNTSLKTYLEEATKQDEGTVLVWFKVSHNNVWTDGQERTLFRIGTTSTDFTMTIRKEATNNRLRVFRAKNGTNLSWYVDNQSGTDWLCMAMTWSSSADEQKLYLNGVLDTDVKTNIPVGSGKTINNKANILAYGTSDRVWDGQIAHLAFWSKALTQAQITTLSTI